MTKRIEKQKWRVLQSNQFEVENVGGECLLLFIQIE